MQGQLTLIDLNACRKEIFQNKYMLKKFAVNLSKLMGFKSSFVVAKEFRHGKQRKIRCLFQITSRGSIKIYADESERKVFVDAFSFEKFDAIKAKQFSQQFFNAGKAVVRTVIRE